MVKKVLWSIEAKKQLKDAYEYIREDSLQNAIKVRKEIVESVRNLPQHPEKYNPDKYKYSNDGSYRAFERHRYRISYRVLENEIRILRIRHTSMESLEY